MSNKEEQITITIPRKAAEYIVASPWPFGPSCFRDIVEACRRVLVPEYPEDEIKTLRGWAKHGNSNQATTCDPIVAWIDWAKAELDKR